MRQKETCRCSQKPEQLSAAGRQCPGLPTPLVRPRQWGDVLIVLQSCRFQKLLLRYALRSITLGVNAAVVASRHCCADSSTTIDVMGKWSTPLNHGGVGARGTDGRDATGSSKESQIKATNTSISVNTLDNTDQ